MKRYPGRSNINNRSSSIVNHAGDPGAMHGAVINLSVGTGVGTALAAGISVAFLASGINEETGKV